MKKGIVLIILTMEIMLGTYVSINAETSNSTINKETLQKDIGTIEKAIAYLGAMANDKGSITLINSSDAELFKEISLFGENGVFGLRGDHDVIEQVEWTYQGIYSNEIEKKFEEDLSAVYGFIIDSYISTSDANSNFALE